VVVIRACRPYEASEAEQTGRPERHPEKGKRPYNKTTRAYRPSADSDRRRELGHDARKLDAEGNRLCVYLGCTAKVPTEDGSYCEGHLAERRAVGVQENLRTKRNNAAIRRGADPKTLKGDWDVPDHLLEAMLDEAISKETWSR
jgi:hypothetical protein